MKQYRCYFLNGASRIIGAHVFHCDDGAAALHEARRHLGDHECRAAAEVWHDDDYVGCVMRSEGKASLMPASPVSPCFPLTSAMTQSVSLNPANPISFLLAATLIYLVLNLRVNVRPFVPMRSNVPEMLKSTSQ